MVVCRGDTLHARLLQTCTQCLYDRRGGSCTRCVKLGFDCSCACPPLWEPEPVPRLAMHAVIDARPDNYHWWFFRPAAATPGSFSALNNLTGWESDSVIEASFSRWAATRFPQPLPQPDSGKLGGFVATLSSRTLVTLRSMPPPMAPPADAPAGSSLRSHRRGARVLVLNPCSPAGFPGSGLVQCGANRAPMLMQLDLAARQR